MLGARSDCASNEGPHERRVRSLSDIWVTSDLHLFHPAMCFRRARSRWPTAEEKAQIRPELIDWHTNRLASLWDTSVRPQDTVIVCGDLTANSRMVDHALRWIDERPGVKRFILGNHDPAHPMHRDAHKWDGVYYQAFKSVSTSATMNLVLPRSGDKVRVKLSHLPYSGDRDGAEDRCTQDRLPDEGLPIIHGHVHTEDRVTRSKRGTPQIHIGVDAWALGPVNMRTVADYLELAMNPPALEDLL